MTQLPILDCALNLVVYASFLIVRLAFLLMSDAMVLTLLSAGSNARGQLAQNTEEDSYTLQPCLFADIGRTLTNGSKIMSVVGGANHTLVLISSQGSLLSLH